MTQKSTTSTPSKTTSYKVVLPFYVYAALSFSMAAALLFFSSESFLNHYFHPHILAITHIMTLGWATMIILGASFQFLPVLVENDLYSNTLAYLTFLLSAIGIPCLAYGFYIFNMGFIAKLGGCLIVSSLVLYLINSGISMYKSKQDNIHAIYIFTAAMWLVITAVLGLALVYNFTIDLLPKNSVHYLPLHVHFGIVGWFTLLVIGVASRLIPMFLISKYTNPNLLRNVYVLINTSILAYLVLFQYTNTNELFLIPSLLLLIAILLFCYFCYKAYKLRIRKAVDAQLKLSLFSIVIISFPIILISTIILTLRYLSVEPNVLYLSYGFVIIFGWITSLILGMTFKTLPFIVWTKEYFKRTPLPTTPAPKDLFNQSLFKAMSIAYLLGLTLFIVGLLVKLLLVLKIGSALLLLSALLYAANIIIIVKHKAPPLA